MFGSQLPDEEIQARSRPQRPFQSSKLGLSWNFGTGKVGQLVREASNYIPFGYIFGCFLGHVGSSSVR
jgi:hypothetical protein